MKRMVFIAIFIVTGILPLCSGYCGYLDDNIIQEVKHGDLSELSITANKIMLSAEKNIMNATKSTQITQIAEETQMQFSVIIIRQNDEIIKLLKQLNGGKGK